MQRRTFITAAGTAGLSGLAGCSGVPDDLTFTAAPATIDPSAASEAGYETKGANSLELERTVDVGGESRTVQATSWITTYAGDNGPVVVASTPNATVLGQSLNPLARLSGSELITRLLEEFGSGSGLSINNLEAAGTTPITVFETEATVEEFTAAVETSGGGGPANQFTGNSSSSGGVPIRLYLLSVSHEYSDGNDVISALAFQPQKNVAPETIYELYRSLSHPQEPPESTNSSQ
jgi:hypothetical protein